MELTQIWPDLKEVPTTANLSVSPSARSPDSGTASAGACDEQIIESSGGKHAPPHNSPANDSELPAGRLGSGGAPDSDSSPIAPSDPATMSQRDTGGARSAAALATTSTDSSADDEGNTDLGQRFVEWLKTNIRERRIEINTPRARVHVLTEGLALITPGIFRDFSPHHWERAQKRFQKIRLHAKTEKDTNVWTCQVAKDRRTSTVKVMLIPNAETALGIEIPEPNPVMTLINAEQLKRPVRSPPFSDKEMTVDQLGATFWRLSKATNIRISPHRLRHTMVTELAASKDIRTLQELLGHTNISTTMQYVHPDMDRMRNLLETFSS
ncbi:MAG: DNA-binding domain-containing protein [Gammaproteobacteria bacterium]|jgi:hypothetical protein|nr:DNA-binding domain-containing protein [Gammaproteobacteria bacterium]